MMTAAVIPAARQESWLGWSAQFAEQNMQTWKKFLTFLDPSLA